MIAKLLRVCVLVLIGMTGQAFVAIAGEKQSLVIDTAHDTRPALDRLQKVGVAVVGRYLARCQRGGWRTGQRLIDNKASGGRQSEVEDILSRGLGILSIYQYYSKSPCHFIGRKKGRKRRGAFSCGRLVRYPVFGAGKDGCGKLRRQLTAREAGRMDGLAAVEQAGKLGQPADTAIYFGIDFDYRAGDTLLGKPVCQHIRDYMGGIREAFRRDGRYRPGVYGSGFTLRLLTGTLPDWATKRCGNSRERLVDYTWLAHSLGYVMSRSALKERNWHMYQKKLEARVGGFGFDINTINRKYRDAGFWARRPDGRTAKLLFDQR